MKLKSVVKRKSKKEVKLVVQETKESEIECIKINDLNHVLQLQVLERKHCSDLTSLGNHPNGDLNSWDSWPWRYAHCSLLSQNPSLWRLYSSFSQQSSDEIEKLIWRDFTCGIYSENFLSEQAWFPTTKVSFAIPFHITAQTPYVLHTDQVAMETSLGCHWWVRRCKREGDRGGRGKVAVCTGWRNGLHHYQQKPVGTPQGFYHLSFCCPGTYIVFNL